MTKTMSLSVKRQAISRVIGSGLFAARASPVERAFRKV